MVINNLMAYHGPVLHLDLTSTPWPWLCRARCPARTTWTGSTAACRSSKPLRNRPKFIVFQGFSKVFGPFLDIFRYFLPCLKPRGQRQAWHSVAHSLLQPMLPLSGAPATHGIGPGEATKPQGRRVKENFAPGLKFRRRRQIFSSVFFMFSSMFLCFL